MRTPPGRCRCCGVACQGAIRQRLRVCLGCDECDELHGAQLQGVLMKAVADRKLDPYTAIARSLIDDAQLTGRTIYVEQNGTAVVWIADPPPRWLVVASRSLARGEMPDLQSVVDAALLPYFGRNNTATTREAMQRDLCAALQFVDSSIMDVEITSHMPSLEPGHLVINIRAKTPTLGQAMPAASDVAIPDDIMLRKRAEA